MLIAIIVAEYSKGLNFLLTSDDNVENASYKHHLSRVITFIRLLYQEFIMHLDPR